MPVGLADGSHIDHWLSRVSFVCFLSWSVIHARDMLEYIHTYSQAGQEQNQTPSSAGSRRAPHSPLAVTFFNRAMQPRSNSMLTISTGGRRHVTCLNAKRWEPASHKPSYWLGCFPSEGSRPCSTILLTPSDTAVGPTQT